jgi:hypothetical protein
MRSKTRNIIFFCSVFVIIILVSIYSLFLNSIDLQAEFTNACFEYRILASTGYGNETRRFSVTVSISVQNSNIFPVTIQDMSASLTTNGIYMLGSKPPEEQFVLPALGSKEWTQTYYSFGDYADYLNLSETHKVLLGVKGKACSIFNETFFQSSYELIY